MDDKDEQDPAQYAKAMAKSILSHVFLALAVIIYVVGGAFLFIEIEAGKESDNLNAAQNRSVQIEEERTMLADTLWNYKWSDNYNATVDALVTEYHNNITEAIDVHQYKGTIKTDLEKESDKGWGFASALLFTVSVVTTIGYGHVAPKTELGQLVLIVYALVGIPLMLMFLANIGDAMAKFFRTAYGRGCCYCCNKRRSKEYEFGAREHANKRIGDLNGDRPKSAWSEGADKDMGRDMVNIPPEQENPPDDNINVPISLTLVVIAAYVMIGAVLFAAWNDWTWITGAYFSFVTLSTIGFGDLVPGWSDVGNAAGNIKLSISSLYIILGLAVLSMSFNLMMEEMIQKFKWLGQKLGIVDGDEAADDVIQTDDVKDTANLVVQ